MTQQWECWAYVDGDGLLQADTYYQDCNEKAVWLAFGCPSDFIIQAAQQRGARVIRVRIEEIEE